MIADQSAIRTIAHGRPSRSRPPRAPAGGRGHDARRDALVTFLPDGAAVAKTSRNPKAYRAFVEVLKGALANPEAKQEMRGKVMAVGEQARVETDRLERARERDVQERDRR